MPSIEQDNRTLIHDDILPRLQKLEEGQTEIVKDMERIFKEMEKTNNQMRAMELSNNDIKQTVVGYGQTHSLLLTKSMESQVETIRSISSVFQEVKSAKEQTSQVKEKIEGNIQVARLGTKEKVIVAIVGLLTAPSALAGLGKAGSFIINFFK